MERLAVLLLAGLLLLPMAFAQWEDCPFGEVNDTYPGECGGYIDTDGDGICDHSQPAPEERLEKTVEAAGGVPMEPLLGDVGQAAVPLSLIERYNFIEITAIVLIAIVLSELFIKDKLLLKYVWNVALLVSFMAAAITALLYFFHLQAIHGTVVTLHIKLGLVAVWIGIYHAIKRASFYTKCVPWKRKNCTP